MVSGLVTSPLDRSNISSGEAKLIVIFEKSFRTLLSFLKAMILLYKQIQNYINYSVLVKC